MPVLLYDPTAPRKKWALTKFARDVWNPAHPKRLIARPKDGSGFNPDTPHVGEPARAFLREVQKVVGLPVTGKFDLATMQMILPIGARGRVMARAHAELGETEWPPGSNWGPVSEYIKAAGFNYGVPWCGCFVYWVLSHEGFKKLPLGAAAVESWLNYGSARKLLKPVSQSRSGDLWIWNFSGNIHAHIGFCDEGVKGNTAYYVDGNVGANGGTVTDSSRYASQIHAVIDLDKLWAVR
jgi:hypothetical protein